jgi:tyrosyl-tRNA synthetase
MPPKEVEEFGEKLENGFINPKDAKISLAFEIVKLYHGEKEAKKTQEEFIKVFSKKQKPSEVPTQKLKTKNLKLIDLIMETKLVASKSEARRLIEQGGVKIDEAKKTNPNEIIEIKREILLQIGRRRFLRIK